MKSKILIVIAALVLTVGATQDRSFDRIWHDYGPEMEKEDITRPMAKAAFLWTELQYHIAFCKNYLLEDDVQFWRDWWKNTPIERSVYGRKILEIGANEFAEGERDRLRRPPPPKLCSNVLAGWRREMDRESP